MHNIKIFDDKQVRTVRNAEQEKWHVSVVDVIVSRIADFQKEAERLDTLLEKSLTK